MENSIYGIIYIMVFPLKFLLYIPEAEKCLFCEAGAGSSNGHDKSGDTKGWMDWNKSRSKRCCGRFTTQQKQKAKEANNKLEKRGIY